MAFHSLAIGTSALLTARYGLDVTGQNLSNIDTPGYSRQRLNQAATNGWSSGLNNAVIGTGVWTTSVSRIANEHVEKQLRQATSSNNYYATMYDGYQNLQAYFGKPKADGQGATLADSMSSFWSSMSDFSSHVEMTSTRTTLLKQAEALATHVNSLGTQLRNYRQAADDQVAESVNQINSKLNEIAALNQAIVKTEDGGATGIVANDLRDRRGEVIKELYAMMDIDAREEPNGSAIISIHGRTLVYFDQVNEVKTERVLSGGMTVTRPVFATDSYPLEPKNGQLAALMELRDVTIKSYMDDLDKLSGTMIWEFNRIYSQTRGLETFDFLKSKNAPIDPSVTLDKLQFPESNIAAGTFEIKNGRLNIIVHNRNTDSETTVPIDIDLDGREGPNGEPDMILWDPDNPDASNSLVNRIQAELDKNPDFAGVFEVKIDRNYNITIESKSEDYGFCFGEDTSGVLAALGLNTFFTGYNSMTMGVNQDLHDNPNHIGSSYSFKSGDNAGVNALLALQDMKVFSSGATLSDFYASMAGRLGSEASRAGAMYEMQVDITQRMYVQRESVSGVSEDEEGTKLIMYQRAFQGAAKFITTVDILYETLINM